jgi:fatty acid desaturase
MGCSCVLFYHPDSALRYAPHMNGEGRPARTEEIAAAVDRASESAFPGAVERIPLPREFFERENLKAAGVLFVNVAAVLAAGPLAFRAGHAWAYLLAFVIVGARAEALYILQHECMHSLLFSRRSLNQAVGLGLSGLLGTRLFEGRRVHFKHHREVGEATDPNEMWHGIESRAPGWPALRFFIVQLCGGRLVTSLRQLRPARPAVTAEPERPDAALPARQRRQDLAALGGSQLAVLAFFWLASAPWVYVAFYLAPLVTLTSLFEALRSFSEHVLPGATATSVPERHRLYFMDASRAELFFISALHFNYHHLHHLYPSVVTFKLRALHRWLQENDPQYASKYVRRRSYVGTALQYILNRPIAGAGECYPVKRAA